MWDQQSLSFWNQFFFSRIWNQTVIFHTDGRLSGSDEGASDTLRTRWEAERMFYESRLISCQPYISVSFMKTHRIKNKIELPELTLWPRSRIRLLKISETWLQSVFASGKARPTLAHHQKQLLLTNSQCREAGPKGCSVLRCLFNFHAVIILMDFLFSLFQNELIWSEKKKRCFSLDQEGNFSFLFESTLKSSWRLEMRGPFFRHLCSPFPPWRRGRREPSARRWLLGPFVQGTTDYHTK